MPSPWPETEDAAASLLPVAFSSAYRFRSLTLTADSTDTPPLARHAARDTLHDWELPRLADDVELCVSELVGNAVRYAAGAGAGRITVTFRYWPRRLFLEVADENPTPPTLPSGDPIDPLDPLDSDPLLEGGRGLFIVQSLADATWWAPRASGGKSVFCRFDLAQGAPGAGRAGAP
ncbi:ATP-binding protein [Streptomyces sp. RFCAC02]|uniref:ATP-binding protein n=1 Tax=Streptomyces sp. RFCAC02 TaxID=2499143 RepID=UPI00101F95A9|nr:ATP-binding protein [Streptomyces sp. RFCAC02]